MILRSLAFDDGMPIPVKYTCDGENINPPLLIEEAPDSTISLVIMMEDMDVPGGFVHWMMWNIDPEIKSIEESELPSGAEIAINDFGEVGYGGPCPQEGMHHYRFRVFALSQKLDLPTTVGSEELINKISDLILDQDEFSGTYGNGDEAGGTLAEDFQLGDLED